MNETRTIPISNNCIEIGRDVKRLNEILGHSKVDINLNLYVHSNGKLKKKYKNRKVFCFTTQKAK